MQIFVLDFSYPFKTKGTLWRGIYRKSPAYTKDWKKTYGTVDHTGWCGVWSHEAHKMHSCIVFGYLGVF